MSHNNNEVMVKIYQDITEAWNTLNAELIIKHLSHNFRYDSQWVYDTMGYHEYCEYLREKFNKIRQSGSNVVAEFGTTDFGPAIRLNQNGNIGFYQIEIEDGKVVKADMCMF